MAAIGKIRENSTLLLIVIGGAMVAFVLGDIFSGGGRSQAPGTQKVGEVLGQEIDARTFELRVQQEQEARSSAGQALNDQVNESIRNQVWNQLLMEEIVGSQMEALGMKLTKDEYDDIRFGNNVSPMFIEDPTFTNPETGRFDPDMVRRYFQLIQTQYPAFFRSQQARLINDRSFEKYNNLVKKGVFANRLEAGNKFRADNGKATVRFVAKKYSDVADSLVTVTDADLKKFYDNHKNEDRFKVQASADIEYVTILAQESEDDRAETMARMSDYIEDFANTKNDSLFVQRNSDIKRFDPVEFNPSNFPEMAEALNNASVGDVVGPYEDGSYIKIAKIKELMEEDQATVRHILLQPNDANTTADLKKRADSLMRVIKQGTDFAAMVNRFSSDPGSVSNGGVYDWFNRQTMVPEFTEAAFKAVGTMSVAETSYGIHLVEVLGRRTAPLAMVLTIDRRIEPSNQTMNLHYDKAAEISISSKNLEDFKLRAAEAGYEVKGANKVLASARMVPGIPNSREVVRWANDEETKIGKVSQVFEAGNQFVVAVVNARRTEGPGSFADWEDKIRELVIKDKKAVYLQGLMQGASLDDIATGIGARVQTSNNISGSNTTFTGGLNEPYVAGVALTLGEGVMSIPLKGESGVFVIEVQSFTEAEEPEDYNFAREEVERSAQGRVSTINGAVYNALKELAGVKDDRAKFF
jgi:peptidyl-prolyl cis-trans isomerase D